MSKSTNKKIEILRKLRESDKIDADDFDKKIIELEEEAETKKEELRDCFSDVTLHEVEEMFLGFVPIRLN